METTLVDDIGSRLTFRVHSTTVEIVDIEVPPQHRGKGFGRKLLEMLFRHPHVADQATVYAITRTDNLIAQHFYERCQFEVTAVLRRFYSRGERAADAVMYGRSPRGPV